MPKDEDVFYPAAGAARSLWKPPAPGHRLTDEEVFYPEAAERKRREGAPANDNPKTDAEVFYKTDPAEALAKDFGIDRRLGEKFLEIEKRGGVLDQPTEDQLQQNEEETYRLLREEFGVDMDKIIERMRRMVQTRPGLAKALEVSGAGSHQALVMPLARAAAAQLEAEEKRGRP